MSENLPILIALGGLALSAATFLMVWFRGRKGEVKDDVSHFATLDGKMTAAEERLEKVEAEVGTIRQQLATLPQISAQISALDRLVSFRLDNLQTTVDRLADRADRPDRPH